MHLASRLLPSDLRLEPIGRRGIVIALVIGLHALLLLMLLTLAPPPSRAPKRDGSPLMVEFLPEPKPTPERARPAAREKAVTQVRKPKVPAPEPIPPVPPVPSIWTKIIPLSKEEFAQSDIAELGKRRRPGAAGEGSGAGAGPGTAEVEGGGPNGEKLYNADWYKRPTDAELGAYLPKSGVRFGWGAVACRTVANFRVEDCEEIGQFPPGSGLSRAVREAAWQFRVRPPRVGGKSLVGAWVRIRIDYSERGVGTD